MPDALDTLKQENQALRTALIHEATRAAAARIGAFPELLTGLVEQSATITVHDGKVAVRILDAAGNPRVGNARGDMMGVDGLLAEIRKEPRYAAAFPEAPASPDRLPSGTAPVKGGLMTRTAFDALSPAEQHRAVKTGTKIVD